MDHNNVFGDSQYEDVDDILMGDGDEFDIENQLQPPANANVVNVDFRELPLIRMEENIKENVDQVIERIATLPTLFKRNGLLVQVATVAADPTSCTDIPTARIYDVPAAKLKSIISNACRFEGRDNRDNWVAKKPSPDIAQAVFHDVEFEGVRELHGVAEAPLMRLDRSVLSTPGYDPETKLLYAPKRAYKQVADRPTLADAKKAYELLAKPWADFPTTSAVGRMVPVAAVVTIVCRHAIGGSVPAFVFDASTPGSGKSIQANCVSILATGRYASFTNWPTENVEVEKVLDSQVLNGSRLITFDNIHPGAVFGCAALDAKLTAVDTVSFRILGQTRTVEVPWRSTIMATGNNVVLGSDTVRRTIIQRLEPSMEKPEERDRSQYSIPDLTGWCMANHVDAVHAALTIVRAYHVAGRPLQGTRSWGSFEAWTDTIANALRWVSGLDVLENRAAVAGEVDEKTVAFRAFLPRWKSFAPNGMTAGAAIKTLYTVDYMRGQATFDGLDPLREAIETMAPPDRQGQAPHARAFGNALRAKSGQWVGGLKLAAKPDRNGIQVWTAVGEG